MNLKNSLWQFVKDGLVGVAIGLIPFAILTISILISEGSLNDVRNPYYDNYFGAMFFFQDSFISPMPFVILIVFISMGIGGRFLENITSRWGLLKPILIIAIVTWIIGIVLLEIQLQLLFLEIGFSDFILPGIGITGLGAGIGFLIAGLAGVKFNPSKRLFRLIIGSIASTVAASTVELIILLLQTVPMV